MLSRLTRIMLALVTAFVFTGQMEAAAEHCARLAKAAEAVEAAAVMHADVTHQEAAPCHEASAAETHKAPVHQHDHSQAPNHCACIAGLTGWVGLIGTTNSVHVEAYAWLTPQQIVFASAKPDPDFRPPRA